MDDSMKKILALTISSLFLVACGGGGSSDNGSNNDQPSLSDISGIWDARETDGDEVDELYLVIKDYGEIITYDYDGDSYDQGSDCYYKYTDETITDLGNGNFEIYEDYWGSYNVKLHISDNQLIGDFSDGYSFSMPKSSLKESDFVPLCNEYSMSLRAANHLSEIKQNGVLGLLNRSN